MLDNDLTSIQEDGDFDAPRNNHYTALPSASQRAVSLAQDGRDRPSSFASSQHDPSAHGQHGIRSRSGSLVSRVTSRIGPASPNSLTPVDSVGKSSKKSKRRSRRRSINSQMSGHSSVVAALAKGGLHIASATGDEALAKAAKTHKVSSGMKRSPYLTRGGRDMDDDDDDGESDDDDIDFDDEEDDDSDLAEDLSVLGYAVASNRRNSDFHALFPSVDEGDYLIDGKFIKLAEYMLMPPAQTMDVPFQKISWCKADFTSLKITSASMPTSLAGQQMQVILFLSPHPTPC